jgi:hypothetical protein
MQNASTSDPHISTLALEFELLYGHPDWPVVAIRIDGEEPFATVAPDWGGFDPKDILGPAAPLLPVEPNRRVAVYRCSCHIAQCGVIAPIISLSADGENVRWHDFQDVAGFEGPITDEEKLGESVKWKLPDLQFDRRQYEAEVARVSKDTSWETSGRATARLLRSAIEAGEVTLPSGFQLHRVSPHDADDATWISLLPEDMMRGEDEPQSDPYQITLLLTSPHSDPARAAAYMVNQLRSTDHQDWVATFHGDTLP